MALEHILAVLEREVAAQIARMEAESGVESERIRAAGEAEAAATRAQTLDAIEPRIRSEYTRRVNAARLEVQHVRLEMQETLIQAVYQAAQERLVQTRARPDYALILAALVDEVLGELGTPLELEIDPRDADLIHQHLLTLGHDVTVEQTLQTWGGVIGNTLDRRISVDNRLETRFAQVRERYRGDVANLLNSEETHAG